MTLDAPQEHAAGRRRVPMALITWAFMSLVLLVVAVLIVLKVTRGATAVPPPSVAGAPASVVRAVTGVPAAAFDAVGAPRGVTPAPQVLQGEPALTAGGHPEVVFVGAEFSPFSAAARWALVAALGRFGTFGQLGATQSSVDELFPRTATFTFDGVSYRSRYVTLTAVEAYGAAIATDAPGGFPVLRAPGSEVQSLLRRYGGAGASGPPPVLPFVDIGNRVVFSGASVGLSPGVLRGDSMAQIAVALVDPTTSVAQAVLGAANELSAALCEATGMQPAAVCSSPGVRAGAARLGLG